MTERRTDNDTAEDLGAVLPCFPFLDIVISFFDLRCLWRSNIRELLSSVALIRGSACACLATCSARHFKARIVQEILDTCLIQLCHATTI